MKRFRKIEKALMQYMTTTADFLGKPLVFTVVLLLTLGWFMTKLTLDYDTWFDIMDVFVFLASFFLLFIIQSSQNADNKAIQDKLDEIIEALPQASNKKEHEEELFKKGDK